MKKTLFMGALALTIATSMVAGTMAVYTHSDVLVKGTENDLVTAKKFYVGSTTTNPNIDIRLAPGESKDWGFNVTNIRPGGDANGENAFVSEVDMDLKISVEFVTTNIEFKDITCTLYEKGGQTALAKGVINGNKIELVKTDKSADFKAGVKKTKDYILTFHWEDKVDGADVAGTANDQDDTLFGSAPESLKNIKVTITGSQHVE